MHTNSNLINSLSGITMSKIKNTSLLSIFIMLLLYLAAFSSPSANTVPFSSDSSASVDYWPTNGWQNSSSEQHGMDSGKLDDMIEYIDENDSMVSQVTA